MDGLFVVCFCVFFFFSFLVCFVCFVCGIDGSAVMGNLGYTGILIRQASLSIANVW